MSVSRLPVRSRSPASVRSSSVVGDQIQRWANNRVYAICFDLDTAEAERHHPTNSETAAYKLIERVFQEHGFVRRQGSVYFGGQDTTAVTCVLAVQALAKRHPWIRFAVRDIRMLRIEENNDLAPALGKQGDIPLDNASGI